MIKEMAVLAMFVSFGVVSPFCSVKAQVVPSIDVTPPEIVKNSQTSSTAFASLDDVSANADLFGPLAEMFKELAKPIGNVQRGSREIAIFRQAAPAVVLIKTKDGLGSGVVLQDGQIVTNRHVV